MNAQVTVGFDGSPASRTAVRWAGNEASTRVAALRIVSCYRLPLAGDSAYAWTPSMAYEGLLESADASMHEVADEVHARHPDLEILTVPSAGPVGPILVDESAPGDIVVVGASTHSRTAAVLFGNTAHYLVRRSPCPVAVVPAAATLGGPDRVVVGVDGSDDAMEALLWAGEAADRYGVALTVVHAWEYPYRPVDPPSMQVRDLMRIDAARVLQSAVTVVRDRFGAAVQGELVEASPAAGLIDTVRDGDLLVLGSRGRGAIRSAVFGSTVNSVLDSTAVPVVVVRCTVPPCSSESRHGSSPSVV
jgi:nucleotide-binding universal stress UspA family protein